MAHIFVNIPVTDLERAKAFYTAIGGTLEPRFTDDNGACITWGDTIALMILRREFFATFTDKPVADPTQTAQVGISFQSDSRDDVDRTIERGLAAGGAEPRPAQDLGFMYSRDLDDPDGNGLGFFFMEPEAADQEPEAAAAQQGQA